MILEYLLDLVLGIVEWFLGLFDDLDIPSWLSPSGQIQSFISNFASVGVWIPWTVMASVVTAVVATYSITFVVKLVKQILAHVPGFGGAG